MVNGKIRSIEAFALQSYKKGQIFYTHKSNKDITSIAGYYKRKISTTKFIAINTMNHKQINEVVKVELLD